jgi:hypothetical protein
MIDVQHLVNSLIVPLDAVVQGRNFACQEMYAIASVRAAPISGNVVCRRDCRVATEARSCIGKA